MLKRIILKLTVVLALVGCDDSNFPDMEPAYGADMEAAVVESATGGFEATVSVQDTLLDIGPGATGLFEGFGPTQRVQLLGNGLAIMAGNGHIRVGDLLSGNLLWTRQIFENAETVPFISRDTNGNLLVHNGLSATEGFDVQTGQKIVHYENVREQGLGRMGRLLPNGKFRPFPEGMYGTAREGLEAVSLPSGLIQIMDADRGLLGSVRLDRPTGQLLLDASGRLWVSVLYEEDGEPFAAWHVFNERAEQLFVIALSGVDDALGDQVLLRAGGRMTVVTIG